MCCAADTSSALGTTRSSRIAGTGHFVEKFVEACDTEEGASEVFIGEGGKGEQREDYNIKSLLSLT